jgi:hypothetical protein
LQPIGCETLQFFWCENVLKTIFGTKVIVVVREDLKECKIRPHLWLQDVVGKTIKPIAFYVLIDEGNNDFSTSLRI